jgi:hypothetical protein
VQLSLSLLENDLASTLSAQVFYFYTIIKGFFEVIEGHLLDSQGLGKLVKDEFLDFEYGSSQAN